MGYIALISNSHAVSTCLLICQWNGMEWSMIILKGAGRPGQLRPDFFSKMDFARAPVSQNFSNDKDKILQDVSSLPFYPKIEKVDSLFRIPTFFFGPTFCPKNSKTPKTR